MLDQHWNEVFKPLSKPEILGEKQKAMVAMAAKSKSTASIGLMAAPAASMVEYALTKGMGRPAGKQRPMSIKIAVDERTTVTAIRRDVVIEGNRCTWRGVVEGTENPVTLMWWNTGRITGTIHYGAKIFQLRHMGKAGAGNEATDVIGVVASSADMLPDEHAPVSPERMRRMRARDDGRAGQGGSGSSRPRPTRDEARRSQDDLAKGVKRAVASTVGHEADARAHAKGRRYRARRPAKVVIDVMV